MFGARYVWIELKYKLSLAFVFTREKIPHQSKFCEASNDQCIYFGGKYFCFGEWLRSDTNMKVLAQVKDGGLRKQVPGGFSFSVGDSGEKKRSGVRAAGNGKENAIFGARKCRVASNGVEGLRVKTWKKPKKGMNDVTFMSNIEFASDLFGKNKAMEDEAAYDLEATIASLTS